MALFPVVAAEGRGGEIVAVVKICLGAVAPGSAVPQTGARPPRGSTT